MPDLKDSKSHPEGDRLETTTQLATIGAMVPDLVHKIGTPLNIILANAELLESSVQDERGAARLLAINEQIDRITTILHAFLDLAHPEEPCFGSNSIQQVIEDSLIFASEELEQRAVCVSTSFAPAPAIICDGNRLKDLFTKLFLNAANAMNEEGGGELNIALETCDRDLLIRVKDNGEGIHPNNLPQIFEPFFTTRPSGQGCGLGLVAAQQIAEQHGGTIQVESEVGKGTTFFVRLPLDKPTDSL